MTFVRRGLIGLAVLVLWAGAAFAHASLLSTTPADGALVAAPPAAVTLRFNEPVRPLVARLTAADGSTRLLEPARVEGLTLTYPMPTEMGQGTHLLSWRVTSEDGHPLAGGLLFSVGTETGPIEGATASPATTRVLVWAARAGLILSVLFAVGGAAFGALLGGGSALPRWAAWSGLFLLPVVLAGQGLDLLGLPPSALIGAGPWREGAAGPPALALLLSGGALVAVLLRGPWWGALLLAGVAAATSGHAATAEPRAFMRPAVALHVGAAALWIGALWPLACSLGRPGVLTRFGRAIPWVLTLLLASGCGIAVVQLRHLSALWQTDYGRVLLAKIALVAALLLVAAVNRFRLTARAEAGDTAPLRRAIGAELVLAVLIVGTVALWRFTPPPRSLPPPLPDRVQPIAAEGLSARLRVAPPRQGPVTLSLEDLRLDGAPVVPQAIEVDLAKPAYGIGPFRRAVTGTPEPIALGRFVLPLDGYWVLTLQIRVSDFRSIQLRDIVEIAPAR